MNRSVLSTVVLTTILLSCSAARGQGCATTLSPHFSVYTSVARDGKNIHTSVTMQGYASVAQGPGCNMSVATHHVGAENKLNNVDHWTYSGNGCPTCYFTATDNEQIVGVPGVVYPFLWDGQAICSMVGGFYGSGGSGGLPGCVVPSSETTAVVGPGAGRNMTLTLFNQTISDSAGDNFAAMDVEEGVAAAGADTCHFTGSMYAPLNAVTGGTWPVAGGNVAGQYNHWGYDNVGWFTDAVTYYRAQAPGHGIGIPCGFTFYQSLKIMCNANTWWVYTPSVGNKLTGTIDHTDVVNCRYDMNNSACETITY